MFFSFTSTILIILPVLLIFNKISNNIMQYKQTTPAIDILVFFLFINLS